MTKSPSRRASKSYFPQTVEFLIWNVADQSTHAPNQLIWHSSLHVCTTGWWVWLSFMLKRFVINHQFVILQLSCLGWTRNAVRRRKMIFTRLESTIFTQFKTYRQNHMYESHQYVLGGLKIVHLDCVTNTSHKMTIIFF